MASLTLVTPPSEDTEPLTLDEIKRHCRVDIEDDDALLLDYLPSARGLFERITGRQVFTAEWALRLDCWPCWIDVPKAPLVAVTSITYLDTAGDSQTLAADQYRVDAPVGPTAPRGRIEPAYGVTWPSTYNVSNAITVTFTAGYGTTRDVVPPEIKQWIRLTVGHWYANRESVVVGVTANEMPLATKSLLTPFKTWAR